MIFWEVETLVCRKIKEFNSYCCSYQCASGRNKRCLQFNVDRALSSNYTCLCKIRRPLGEVKCVANSAVAIGVKILCE
jgi:hypothetical protein